MDNKQTNPIREARLNAGLSQDATATAIGVTKSAISSWENERTYPRPALAARLVEVFPNLKIGDLYQPRTA